MRVAIDVSPLRQSRAGTARYVRALLTHAQVDYAPLTWGADGRAAAAARDLLWYPWLLPMKATASDVLHCPTFRAPARSRVPTVVTVHDLAVLRHPETFNRWTRTYSRVAVPRVAGAAARVIAVSQFTRREIVELLRVPESRVQVVPNGLGEIFRPEGAAAAGDYVLAVGTLEPRKNLARAAAAAQRLGLELRVAGGRGWAT
jgi:glycosyltransferase involved in cell wall biosynthesis